MIPNLLPQLNNFSLSLDGIIKDYKEVDSTPKELSFIDLSPLLPPPPVDGIDIENEEESKETENIFDPLIGLNNLSKKIVTLQNSINDIFTNNNELIENQRQFLYTLKNQNSFYDLKFDDGLLQNPYGTNVLKEISNTITIRDNVIEKYITNQPNTDLNSNQSSISKIGIEYTNLPKINLDGVSVPINIEQLPNIDLPKLENLKISVDYLYPNNPNIPKLSNDDFKIPNEIFIPLKYGEIKTPTIPINYEIPDVLIDAKVRYNFENNLEIPQINPIRIPTILDNPEESIPIKLDTILQMVELKQFNDLKLPNIESIDVPLNYEKTIKPSFDLSGLDTPKINLDIDTDPIKNYFETLNVLNESVSRKIPIDIDTDVNLPINYNKPILESNTNLVDYTKLNNDLISLNVDNILKQDGVNENTYINYPLGVKGELNLSNEGTLEKMSTYLNSLIESENQNIDKRIDQLSIGVDSINTNFNDLITEISLDKLTSVNKSQNSMAMISMVDKNQFSMLMDILEKNSKIVSDNLNKNKSKSEVQNNTSLVNFTTTQNKVNDNDKSGDILKVMSSLDEKMGLMINAIHNLSTIMIDSKPNNFSLRPNKHY